MPDQCPNHGVFSVEQKQAAVQRLADALTLMLSGDIALGEGVQMELQHMELCGGLQGLPMDMGVIAFREPSRISRHKLAYTVDWLLKREPNEIAKCINEAIFQRLPTA
jgi:hypothetical protein